MAEDVDILGEAIVDKPKTFWSYIKGLRKDLVGVAPLKVGNTIISDSGKKAEALSSQFKSVFTEEDTTDIPSLDQPCTPPMEHIEVSTDGVEKMLQVHDIAGALNSKRQVDLAILDFTKAFDKVPHGRLISKLEYYGIQGPTLKWLKAFLTNREQTVVVEGKASAPVKVASGSLKELSWDHCSSSCI
ncbi:DTW domain-containing protein 2 [Branchiostoma belcheri]|nr:DTW domain-containing protein 2 [Branchiostoma belcheri]